MVGPTIHVRGGSTHFYGTPGVPNNFPRSKGICGLGEMTFIGGKITKINLFLFGNY